MRAIESQLKDMCLTRHFKKKSGYSLNLLISCKSALRVIYQEPMFFQYNHFCVQPVLLKQGFLNNESIELIRQSLFCCVRICLYVSKNGHCSP